MAFNKQYNTRFSGRFNAPGEFVAAVEHYAACSEPRYWLCKVNKYPPTELRSYINHLTLDETKQDASPSGRPSGPAGSTFPPQPAQLTQPPLPRDPPPKVVNPNLQTIQINADDVAMEEESETPVKKEEEAPRPHWMKNKLAGVKKVSNRERRRRQNENLRRLLTPKNALMVLNEMMPNEQVTNQFKVEVDTNNQFYKSTSQHSFCADLNLDGNSYKGYGENKLMARNAAAEQAIRDLIIKKMNKVIGGGGDTNSGGAPAGEGCDEESLPMIQLASFALHKLFSEWEYEGHKVPQLKPTVPGPEAEPRAERRAERALPAGAAGMHPCMLLTYMRPHLEYRELAVEGDRPQNMLYTMGVDVDGATYIGKASNKKEARKQAAAAACRALFGVHFASPAPAAHAAPAAAK